MLIFAPKSLLMLWFAWSFFKYIFLDNGVMTTSKRRVLSFVFTVLIPFLEKDYSRACKSNMLNWANYKQRATNL